MVTHPPDASAGWSARDFRGGHPALDFANTVGWRRSERPIEFLADYADLVAWCEAAGLLTAGEARRLARTAGARPAEAAAVLARAQALRTTIHLVFAALAAGKTPARAALAELSRWSAEAGTRRRLAVADGSVVWAWTAGPREVDRMLWPLAWAAAELLTDSSRRAVRECAGDSCGWLFIDASNSGRRRWCSMSDCGNRAKVRRHRHRQRRVADA